MQSTQRSTADAIARRRRRRQHADARRGRPPRLHDLARGYPDEATQIVVEARRRPPRCVQRDVAGLHRVGRDRTVRCKRAARPHEQHERKRQEGSREDPVAGSAQERTHSIDGRRPHQAHPPSGCRDPDIPLWSSAVVLSARHMSRRISVLLLAGLWVLALVWMPATTRLSEDHAVTSLGQVETAYEHPATETPKFGAPEHEASVDGHAVLACARPHLRGGAVGRALVQAEQSASRHRHDTAHFARGPPTRA
jgi:hypothetical protein